MSSVTLELLLAYYFRHEFINSRLADSMKKEGRKASRQGSELESERTIF